MHLVPLVVPFPFKLFGAGMKIFSCIKPVPDPASRLIINDTKTWIKDQDLTFVASEADNYALEESLRLKEKHGGEAVVISMGGEEAARVLRSRTTPGAPRSRPARTGSPARSCCER